jgi:hypothetical protein
VTKQGEEEAVMIEITKVRRKVTHIIHRTQTTPTLIVPPQQHQVLLTFLLMYVLCNSNSNLKNFTVQLKKKNNNIEMENFFLHSLIS